MPIIQTPKELGLAVRSRRKELGWDQATLAHQIGVTRQWVIDIEKGKPRAELALAMRAVRVLGMSLTVESRTEAASRESSASGRPPSAGMPDLDINAIVETNRRSADSPASVSTAAHQLQAIEAVSRLDCLASSQLRMRTKSTEEKAAPKRPGSKTL